MADITPFPSAGKQATLSVCVIFGNEAVHIRRFIDSFKCIADEFVFVRAIGASTPDNTWDQIQQVCKSDGITYQLEEYVNGTPEAKGWQHIDRFDLARQKAFDLAKSDLRMWADCDDILGPTAPVAIAGIKADTNRMQVYFGPYELPMQDHSFLRERIIGRIPATWKGAVHEAMVLPGDCRRAIHQGLVIQHMPLEKKMPSVDRNLRILEHALANPQPDDYLPQTYFYLHRDYYIHPNGDREFVEKAFDYALKYVKLPGNPDTVQKYECLFNLCQLLTDHPDLVSMTFRVEQAATLEKAQAVRERYALSAFRIDPSRREALAQLILLELERNAPKRGLAYVNAMRGIPEPQPAPWTHQKPVYAWKGALLHTMCLRRTNQEEEARKLEDHIFERSGKYFSVLHATRRGTQALAAMYLWLATAQNAGAIEWIFAVDEDDEKTLAELNGYRVIKIPGKDKGPVAAWNMAAKESQGSILLQMSDDWTPMIHWDRLIIDRIGNVTQEAVLQISDGHRTDDLLCMAILTRAYYDRYDYIFHPDYFSMYSDNEFTLQAQKDGVIRKASGITFTHNHPIFSGDQLDEVYQRSNHPDKYKDGLAVLDSHKYRFVK